MSHLITDLLLLSSLEQNTVSELFKPCCLNDLINDLSEEFLELAVASNIQLSSHIPVPLIYVLGHEQQLLGWGSIFTLEMGVCSSISMKL